MKKKTIRTMVALGLAVALGGAALASTSAPSSSVVTRSYLEGTFFTALSKSIDEWIQNGFAPVQEEEQERLERIARQHLLSLGVTPGTVEIPSGWSGSDTFTAQRGQSGDAVSLLEGSGILWQSGTGTTSGTLVDVTDGREIPSGSTLQEGHRYLAVELATITAGSSANWSVEGVWDSTVRAELPFVDVPEGSWFYDAVYYVYNKGLYNGTSATEFSPSDSMERGMMTTVLHRLAGSPTVDYEPIFSDIPDGTWYTDGTVWAGKNQIVNGVGDQLFEPGDPVSRQQIAVILYNYADFVGADTSGRRELSGFTDGSQVAGWAQDAVSWAVAAGIIQGSDGGRILPNDSATRAEVAIMLQRFENWLN